MLVSYLNIVQEPIDQWIDKRKNEIEKYISENPMENGVLKLTVSKKKYYHYIKAEHIYYRTVRKRLWARIQ